MKSVKKWPYKIMDDLVFFIPVLKLVGLEAYRGGQKFVRYSDAGN